MWSDSPVLDYVFVHSREVEGGWIEVTQLCLPHEILDPDVYDVQHSGGEHVVVPEKVCVYGKILLDVEEAVINLPYQKTGRGKNIAMI